MSTATLRLAIEADSMLKKHSTYEEEIDWASTAIPTAWRFENLVRRRVHFEIAAIECVREIAQWVSE